MTIGLSVVLSILLVSAVMGEDLANKTPQLISKMRHFLQFRYNIPVLATILPKNIEPTPTDEEEFEAALDVHINCIDETETNNTINILYILHTVYILSSRGTPALAPNNCRIKYI